MHNRGPAALRALPSLFSLLALLLVVPTRSQADWRQTYTQNIRINCDKFTDTSFNLIATNVGTRDIDHPRVRLWVEEIVFAEVGFNPVIEFLGGSVRLAENEQYIDTVDVRPNDFPAYLDPALLKPSVRMLGSYRGVNLHQVRLLVTSPLVNVDASRSLESVMVERMVWRVTVRPAPEPSMSANPAVQDPWGFPLLSFQVLNYPMFSKLPARSVQPWGGAAGMRAWADRLTRDAGRLPLLRLRCARSGVYRILPEDLREAGVDPAKAPAVTLRLLESNQEIPIHVIPAGEPVGAGQADWKAVVFYSPGADMLRRPHRAYWLVSEPGSGGDAPRRMAVAAWEPDRAKSVPEKTAARRELSPFQFRQYSHMLPQDTAHGRWMWVTVPLSEFREIPVEIPSADQMDGNLEVNLQLYGLWREQPHSAALYWNQEPMRTFEQSAGKTSPQVFTVPPEKVRSGSNTLAIEQTDLQESNTPEELGVTAVSLSWISRLVAADNAAAFRFTNSTPDQVLRIVGNGHSPEEVFVVDASNPASRRLLQLGRVEGQDTKDLFAVEPATGTHEYWVATLDTALRPWRIERRDPPSLHQWKQPVDYIALSIAPFRQEVQRLLDLKQQQGLRTLFVDVEDVYDLFGYGEKSSWAIADFLRYAYGDWTEPKPFYVCLIGETSDFLADADGVPVDILSDQVPNYEWGNPGATARGDHPYAYVSGNDSVADLSVGRISVADTDQLRKAIDKIEQYQTHPPPGAWRARHLFFTDDEREFQDIADIIISDSHTSVTLPKRLFLNEYPYEPYFRYVERRRSPEATHELLRQLEQGVSTSIYFGHGGPNIMSSESLFSLRDIPTLRKPSTPTYLGSASCDTAWLDYPQAPFQVSIGELMVKQAESGAVGMYGPVSGASSGMHRTLFEEWYKAVVGSRLHRIGDIALFAQNSYYVLRNSTFVPNQYVLIGDPALPLPDPESKGIDLDVSTSILLQGIAEDIQVRGRTEGVEFGWADISLRDQYGREIIPDQSIRLLDGSFETTLSVEGQQSPGAITLRVDAVNRATGRWTMGLKTLRVIKPDISVDLTTDPPPTTRFVPGQPSKLIPTVVNHTDEVIPNLHVRLMAIGLEEPLNEFVFDLAPRQRWQEIIEGPTPPGITRLELVAGRPASPGFTALQRIPLTVRAPQRSRIAALAMAESGIEGYPLPDYQGTQFFVQLENVSMSSLENLTVQLWRYSPQADANTTLTQPQILTTLPPSGNVMLRMISPRKFPPYSLVPLLIMVENDPATTPTLEMPATVIFERNALVLPKINVRIVPGSVKLSRTRLTRDQTAFLTAQVQNVGRDPVKNLLLELYLDEPWNRKNWVRGNPHNFDTRLQELLPYQTSGVRMRFDMPTDTWGRHRLYVVANSRKFFPEDTYDDNVGFADFSGTQLPDFALSPADPPSSPVLVSPGETQYLYFTVTNNDSAAPTEPTEIVVETASPGRDWEPSGASIPVRSIGPGKSLQSHVRWTPQGRETQVRVTANPERLYLELNSLNNRALYPFYVQTEPEWRTTSGADDARTVWDLSESFDLAVFDQAVRKPTYKITYRRPQIAGLEAQAFDELALPSSVVTLPGDDPAPDDAWAIQHHGLSTSARSTAEPLTLRLQPRELTEDTSYCDLYIQIAVKRQMPDGRPKGRVEIKVGEESGYRVLDGLATDQWWHYVGRFRVPSGGLPVTFKKPDQEIHVDVRRYLLIPSVGRVTSQVVRSDPGGRPFRAALTGETPGDTRLVFAGRWGSLVANGMEWDEWTVLDQLPRPDGFEPPSVSQRTAYFQWEVRLYPTVKEAPSLSEIRLIQQ